jgi:adenylylsulfate kinase
MLLDGDTLRHGLCGDLGFSAEDRSENIRRVSETAMLFFESGHIVLCAFISPFASDRAIARSLIPDGHFVEVYTKCSLEVCTQRDPKGLYQKALKGEIKEFTGISSPYEEPERAEIVAETDVRTVDELIDEMILELMERGIIEE